MGNLAAFAHGAAVVYPSECFDAGATLAAVERERCTSLYGVPTMFVAALEHPDFLQRDLSSLRTGIAAGAPCAAALMSKLHAREPRGWPPAHATGACTQVVLPSLLPPPLPLPSRCLRRCCCAVMPGITCCYGMTETSPVSFQSGVDGEWPPRCQWLRVTYACPPGYLTATRADPFDCRIATVGQVHPHLEAKVVDPATNVTLPRGQVHIPKWDAWVQSQWDAWVQFAAPVFNALSQCLGCAHPAAKQPWNWHRLASCA